MTMTNPAAPPKKSNAAKPKTGEGWMGRLVRRAFAKWPRRRVRPVCRFLITEDMRKNPRCINAELRQRGYTSGDRIVVMLEGDFSRVAQLAHTKIKNPLHALVIAQIYAADMERISSANVKVHTPLPASASDETEVKP
jgi:hypothetical protein